MKAVGVPRQSDQLLNAIVMLTGTTPRLDEPHEGGYFSSAEIDTTEAVEVRGSLLVSLLELIGSLDHCYGLFNIGIALCVTSESA